MPSSTSLFGTVKSLLAICVAGAILGPCAYAANNAATPASGKTFYVSKLGDDSDGASWATAFQTIQKALLAVQTLALALAGLPLYWLARRVDKWLAPAMLAAFYVNPSLHLINLRDGEVIEFASEEIEKLQAEIARKLGYKLVDHRLELYCVPLDDDKT